MLSDQVDFRIHYQLINLDLVWLSLTSFHLAEASLFAFSWLDTLVCAVVQKYLDMFFIYNNSHF